MCVSLYSFAARLMFGDGAVGRAALVGVRRGFEDRSTGALPPWGGARCVSAFSLVVSGGCINCGSKSVWVCMCRWRVKLCERLACRWSKFDVGATGSLYGVHVCDKARSWCAGSEIVAIFFWSRWSTYVSLAIRRVRGLRAGGRSSTSARLAHYTGCICSIDRR